MQSVVVPSSMASRKVSRIGTIHGSRFLDQQRFLARPRDVVQLTAIKKNYGILCNGEFHWLIKVNDCISSSGIRTVHSQTWYTDVDQDDSPEFTVYSWPKGEQDASPGNTPPHRCSRSLGGKMVAPIPHRPH